MLIWTANASRPTLETLCSRRAAIAAAVALALAIAACSDSAAPLATGEATMSAKADAPGTHRQYGVPVKVGNGRARTYVVLDQQSGAPVEAGVALDETAMEGLPAPMPMPPGQHEHSDVYLLQLPARHGTPFQFVELDWNPAGHGYPYTAPHFDFHFYRITRAEREAIVPTDPQWMAKAANFPAPEEIPAGYVSSHLLVGKAPGEVSVPMMGLHWLDLASPELPPQSKPFTATYITGTWDGRVIFDEPMITREFIMAQRESADGGVSIAVPTAKRYVPAGYYPNGYRVGYDAQAKEYRIALTGLGLRD
jgi:uncharacterized protein